MKQLSSEEQGFWAQVDGSGACWFWLGWTDAGRPIVRWEGVIQPASRIAWKLALGPIAPNVKLMRIKACPNHHCINPTHFIARAMRDGQGRALKQRRSVEITPEVSPQQPAPKPRGHGPLKPESPADVSRSTPQLIRPGVWEVRSAITGNVFTVQETRMGMFCDCPSPRARCWHMEEVERLQAA